MKSSLWKIVSLLLAFALFAAACGSDADPVASDDTEAPETSDAPDEEPDEPDEEPVVDEPDAEPVALDYWLWDVNQQPGYELCAAAFTEQNPNITVTVSQFGWGDYWDGLTAGFASGDVPDAFQNHVVRYPELSASGVLTPLNDFVERDNHDLDAYFPGFADLWISPEGQRFGLPKTLVTIALVVNGDMLADAGFTEADLQDIEWNMDDGGTFVELISALSIDVNGVRGNEAGFDPDNVEVYGFQHNAGYADPNGETGFSIFTGSNDWHYLDENPWGTVFQYDDPAFTDVILWQRDLIERGFMTPPEQHSGSGADTIFGAGGAAIQTDGLWKARNWADPANGIANVIFAPTPIGPSGSRASMVNTTGDSVTVASEHQEEAWAWVSFLGSAECHEIYATEGVVLPAIASGTEIGKQTFADNGIDISAFTVHVDEGTTFLFPITGNASEVAQIMGTAIDGVLRGEGDAQTIIDANTQINEIVGG